MGNAGDISRQEGELAGFSNIGFWKGVFLFFENFVGKVVYIFLKKCGDISRKGDLAGFSNIGLKELSERGGFSKSIYFRKLVRFVLSLFFAVFHVEFLIFSR